MIIILFGLAGAGKNFVGNILAKEFGFYFLDADELLTSEMIDSTANHKPFTQPMRDQHTQIIIQKIKKLALSYENIAIAKALYKEKNRQQVIAALPEAMLIQIDSDPDIISKRVGTRHHLIDKSYAKLISKEFEKPEITHKTIINNSGKQAIMQQLKEILESRK